MITVEPTESSLLISEAGTNDAAAQFAALPPLTAARYLVVASEASTSLRQNDATLIDSIRPHAHSTFVALEAGFGAATGGESEPPAKLLAASLGVTVIAPEGRFLSCDGALFAVGADKGWVGYSPLGAEIVHGRRYPVPYWQAQLPPEVKGAVQIPAGLWVTVEADPSDAVHLAEISVHPQKLLIVVGSPGASEPEYSHLLDVLRALPHSTRASAALIGYGETSLSHDTVRRLAAELQEPIRVAHGVTIAGESVRLDLAQDAPIRTFVIESVCTPDGVFELDRWSAPLGLVNVRRNSYRLANGWIADAVPAGLLVRPDGQPPLDAEDASSTTRDALTITLLGDGADARALKRVLAPLRTMLERLRVHSAAQLVPGDTTARRLIRDAFPGTWAPTGHLAVTDDGRVIAASVDDDEFPLLEEQQPGTPPNDGGADQPRGDVEAPAPTVTASVPVATETMLDSPAGEAAPADPRAVQQQAPTVADPAPSVDGNETDAAPHESAASETAPIRTGVRRDGEQSPRADDAAEQMSALVRFDGSHAVEAAAAAPPPTPAAPPNDPADALARALRGSAASADLLAKSAARTTGFDASDAITGAAGRGSADVSLPRSEAGPRPRSAASVRHPAPTGVDQAVVVDAAAATESTSVDTRSRGRASPDGADAPVDKPSALPPVEIAPDARSTAAQRHQVRQALGARYDVASRSVTQLLTQQPGMRANGGDRSALLTTLSVVRVFAQDPTARYDIDFHTCLSEGLAALPTTRSIVVRGLPESTAFSADSVLYSPVPFISGPVDGPATGPVEALIWTTSGRRLDRLMAGTDAATDVIVPARTHLRVLGSADGPVPRLLLAEGGVDDDSMLARLREAAAERGNDAPTSHDPRWVGGLLEAV